jgi:N6-adenosine-specific RNA methylase IME4
MASAITLVRYDAACKALADAKAVDEVKRIRDGAEAMRAYAKQVKNKDLEIDAAEIRMRAEIRIGELAIEQERTVGLNRGARGIGVRSAMPRGHSTLAPPTYSEALDLPTLEANKLVSRGKKLAQVPEAKRERLIKEWRGRIAEENARVTTNLLREGAREEKRDARPAPPLPVGEYRLIYADPPWRYEHIETESRAIENQYPTMSLDEICALKVPAAEDAVLFLWTTSPKLAEALQVIEAWQFSYRTCAVWDKERMGMGYYFRQQHELLLVAARGSLPVPEPSARVSSVIRVRRGVHSRKPVEVIQMLEAMYPTFTEHDRIELFTRAPRAGWSAWGNEPEAVAI